MISSDLGKECEGREIGKGRRPFLMPCPRYAFFCKALYRSGAMLCGPIHRRGIMLGVEVLMDAGASFGGWVKLRRRALRLTQAELAQQVGCSGELIRKIEAD